MPLLLHLPCLHRASCLLLASPASYILRHTFPCLTSLYIFFLPAYMAWEEEEVRKAGMTKNDGWCGQMKMTRSGLVSKQHVARKCMGSEKREITRQ